MIEKKNIDRLFQEKFKDFEAAPPEMAWQNIEERLKKKKKRRVVPIWWQVSGVAALLILGFLIWNLADRSHSPREGLVEIESNNGKNPHPELDSVNESPINADPQIIDKVRNVVDHPKTESIESIENTGAKDEQKYNREDLLRQRFEQQRKSERIVGANANANGPTDKSEKRKSVAESANPGSEIVNNDRRQKNADKNSAQIDFPLKINDTTVHRREMDTNKIAENNSSKAGQIGNDPKSIINSTINPDSSKPGDSLIAETTTPKQDTAKAAIPDSMEELLIEKETNVAVNELKMNRWQISSNVAPIYFSSVSNGSPIDPRFKTNEKEYRPSLSYGLGVQYAFNDKFSLRTGVNAVTLEYNTVGVLISQTPDARRLENVKPNVRGQLIQVDNAPVAANMSLGRTVSQFGGSLNQTIGYIEVPLELSYKLLDRKFGIELIGGFSTLFLNQNDVSIASSGMEVSIGEADNLTETHFSTNVGLGIRYKIFKSFHASVEPVFKYQINTFTNDGGDFKPYFFGVYTGLNYRF